MAGGSVAALCDVEGWASVFSMGLLRQVHRRDTSLPVIAFADLPDEIINHLLYYVSADDALTNLQLVSRRCHQLACSPLLWRHHCRTSFAHWRESHHIQQKLAGPVAAVDWKGLFRSRKRNDERLAGIFEGILSTRH
ncbi:hypothetical protein B0T24DRAFT_596510 [Lasiosphaeria ovina]|uniref:F-box domain-containing protein n=1 Tax=Lasiosphaeria ovina TaxID=92902 RepID=A0AAE0N4F8_9PEZI|nr:hypothetical protein B0T24DRAFT_596510 [Lasiosphaeria ovina]